MGSRMLSRAALVSNSNLTGLNCEKSRSDKSCSRKASASSSVLILGTLRFIAFDLLRMHVASAHRPDQLLPESLPDGESHEQRTSLFGPADSNQSVLEMGVLEVWGDTRIVAQKRLDLGNRNPVLPAM